MFERLKAKLRRRRERKAAQKSPQGHQKPENPANVEAPFTPTVSEKPDAVAPPAKEIPAKEGSPPEPPSDDPKDLWQKALKSLPPAKQQTLTGMGFGQISSGSAESSIDDLLSVVNERQNECEKKFWKVTVGDNEIVLRNYTTQIVGWLEKAGDIAIQFAPPQASLPWSCLKSLMQIPVIEGEQMAALLGTTEKIVRVISRGQVYETVYLRSKPNAATDNLSKNLESALTAIYTTSLELLADSGELFNKSTASRTLQALINPGGVSGAIANLAGQEDELLRDVAACETRRSAEADDSMIGMLEALNAPLTRIDEGIGHLLQNVDETERIKMLEWISPIPFGKHHNNVKDKRTAGTGAWLLQHEGFQNWEKKRSSMLFWLQGSPGTGKTYLTSSVIDRVQDLLRENPKDEGVAFFYCDKNEPSRAQPLSILQSFVRQLSTTVNNPGSTQTQLRAMYKKNRESGATFTFHQCKEQILASLDIYQKSTLVIDAMDECNPDSRDELIEALNSLLSESKKPVKIFISSRPDPDIQSLLENTPNIGISANDNKGDIQKFLDVELEKLAKKTPLFGDIKIKTNIMTALLDRCQGMFQWAALQVHQIVKCKTETSVLARLKNLPSDLKNAYDEAWEQVESLEEPDKTLTNRAMLWVMAADTPLTTSQLLYAVRLNTTGEMPLLADEIDEQGLLSLCNNLLTIDSQLNVWRFAHLSVREYLETRMQWASPRTHFHAASGCLSWFINVYDNDDVIHISEEEPEEEAEPDSLFNVMHPFHLYMRHQWVKHVQGAKDYEKDVLASLLKTFLGSPQESSMQYQRWYKQLKADFFDIYEIPGIDGYEDIHFRAAGINYTGADTCDFNHSSDWDLGEFDSDLAPAESAVIAMCHFSFDTILSDWWESAEFDHTMITSKGHNLLTLAARVGSTSICKSLIDRGVDVNLQVGGAEYGSALEAAAHQGHIETVKKLVESGADVNMILDNGNYGTALVAAVSAGHREIVKYMAQQAHADVNIGKNVDGERFEDDDETIVAILPLATAARRNYNEIVKILVEAGADVNVPELCGNALAAAVRSTNVEAVKYLVQRAKANVNIKLTEGSFASPLEGAATDNKNLEIVTVLLKAGADANNSTENGEWGSPLIAAAFGYNSLGSNVEIVKRLLQAGADANKARPSHDDETPLSQAIYREHIEVIKVLVEAGADVDAPKHFTDAIESNFLDYAMYLIQTREASVDMSLVENKYGSALILAAGYDTKLDFLKYLVDGGADVNQSSEHGDYGNAAAAAARRGNAKALQYLLDAGANTKPLIHSAFISTCVAEESIEWDQKLRVFKILLNAGADVNTELREGGFGSILAAAASESKLEDVKYLVKVGAEVNKPLEHGNYGSALSAAAQQNDIDVVKYLVDIGAEVNVSLKHGKYGSPLAAAASYWDNDITTFLLESGADVNMPLQHGQYGSALAAAVFESEQSQIEILLKAGANVNMPLEHGEYGSALAAAISRDYTGHVRRLLEAGADVNQPLHGRDFGNALSLAAGISVNIVDLLIEAGTKVNSTDVTGRYGNALVSAAAWGQKDCVERLIEAKADVNLNSPGSAFTSALQAAQSAVSEEDMVWIRRRMDDQDDVPEKVEDLKTDRVEVAELLKQHGATV
ncbi:hypothetical protein FE257_001223 [Aspergillus nanangensis]|uniref:NACHT domain-containing protein n=1 Tax=Aspergillus nanangensis TaxID=2582783 RepID=A0AAD4CFN9_ASPNN|nr:hypothetical protein FE257_001223 [Aspergillus nanangensis]